MGASRDGCGRRAAHLPSAAGCGSRSLGAPVSLDERLPHKLFTSFRVHAQVLLLLGIAIVGIAIVESSDSEVPIRHIPRVGLAFGALTRLGSSLSDRSRNLDDGILLLSTRATMTIAIAICIRTCMGIAIVGIAIVDHSDC